MPEDGLIAEGGATAGNTPAAERMVWFGEPVMCPVIGRHALAAGPSNGATGAPAAPVRTSSPAAAAGPSPGRSTGLAPAGPAR